MTPAELRGLSRGHGALAWLATAALVVAIALVWRRRASARWAVLGAAALGAATFVTGVMLHAPFQSKLRQRLFLADEALGWLFERKEHAAFGALALGSSALFAALASRAVPPGNGAAAASLRRACMLALGAALALDGLALVVSILTARRVGF